MAERRDAIHIWSAGSHHRLHTLGELSGLLDRQKWIIFCASFIQI